MTPPPPVEWLKNPRRGNNVTFFGQNAIFLGMLSSNKLFVRISHIFIGLLESIFQRCVMRKLFMVDVCWLLVLVVI